MEKNDAFRESMLNTIALFKQTGRENLLDWALDKLIELPPSYLSDALLHDMDMFLRGIYQAHLKWKGDK
jgi:hypothetical protein